MPHKTAIKGPARRWGLFWGLTAERPPSELMGSLAGFSSLQAPNWGPQFPAGYWPESALISLPWGPPHRELTSSKPARKSIESASKMEATIIRNTITEATSHPLCHTPCVRGKSQVLPTCVGRSLDRSVNTRRGLSVPIAESPATLTHTRSQVFIKTLFEIVPTTQQPINRRMEKQI